LTAKHCLIGAKSLSIRGITKEQFLDARFFVHRNDALDLAAIYFPDPVLPNVKPITLGFGQVLDEVLVLGYPNVPGFTELLATEKAAISARLTMTKGTIVSEATEMFAKTSLFLITARVRGGFSGGPVLSSVGTAVGLVSRQPISGENQSSELYAQYDNLGYGVAIPSEHIIEFLTACKDGNCDIAMPLDAATISYTPL
jgi:S1-C subfamily serine protease